MESNAIPSAPKTKGVMLSVFNFEINQGAFFHYRVHTRTSDSNSQSLYQGGEGCGGGALSFRLECPEEKTSLATSVGKVLFCFF